MHRLFTLAAVCAALLATTPPAFADDDTEPHKKVRVIVTENDVRTDADGKFVLADEDEVVMFDFGDAAEGDPSEVILKWLMEQEGDDNAFARALQDRLEAQGWNRDRLRGWMGRRGRGYGPSMGFGPMGPSVRTWRSGPHVQWYSMPPQVYRWHRVWPYPRMQQSWPRLGMGRGRHHGHHGHGFHPHVDPWGMNPFQGFSMGDLSHGWHGPFGQGDPFGHTPWGQSQRQPRMGFGLHGHPWGQPQIHIDGSPEDMQSALEMLKQLFPNQQFDTPRLPQAPKAPDMRGRRLPVPPGVGFGGMPGMPGMGGGRAELEAAKRHLEMLKQQLEAWEKALDEQAANEKTNVNRADDETLRELHKHIHGLTGDDTRSRAKVRMVTPDGKTLDFEGAPDEMRKQLEAWMKRMQEMQKAKEARKSAK